MDTNLFMGSSPGEPGKETQMRQGLLILGAGQYGSVAKEAAQSMGCFGKIAFLDDCHGTKTCAYHEETIGRLCDYESFAGEYGYAVVAMGDPKLRQGWTARLEEACFRIPVLVSSRAYVSPSAQLRKGCIVEPLAGIHANAVIGEGTLVSMGAVVDHNSMVMDYSHIGCGAVVESGALVESGRKVAPGCVARRRPAQETARVLCSTIGKI